MGERAEIVRDEKLAEKGTGNAGGGRPDRDRDRGTRRSQRKSFMHKLRKRH